MTRRVTLTILFCVAAVVAVAAVFMGRSFLKARRSSRALGCECRLSCLAGAKEQYALAEGLTNGAEANPDGVVEYLKDGYSTLVCPVTGTNSYVFGRIGEPTRCTYHGTSDDCVNKF